MNASLTLFHQWLLAEPSCRPTGCAILIHETEDARKEGLIEGVTDYLNEYDDDGDGRWLAATEELVDTIAADPSQRRLLGLVDDEEEPGEWVPRALAAIASRGHVVARCPVDGIPEPKGGTTFEVGLGKTDPTSCHLVLNPRRIESKCLAHIIGDVFLEWLHGGERRSLDRGGSDQSARMI